MHRLLHRWGARKVLIASLVLAALRWLMIGYLPDSLAMLLIAQLLHAATFGTFHAAAIHLVHHYFQGRLQGRGQALYSSVSFGAGGAIGALGSGFAWEGLGPELTYALASAVAVLGALVAWYYIDSAHDH
jgi:PPP family 3-phenylpropionic acid transporter